MSNAEIAKMTSVLQPNVHNTFSYSSGTCILNIINLSFFVVMNEASNMMHHINNDNDNILILYLYLL